MFALILLGCSAELSNPAFDDAAVLALLEFQSEDPVNLAFAVRQIEADIATYDLDASLLDRSFEPIELTEADVATFENVPDRDPALCLPVAVTYASPNGVDDHVRVQMLADQTPIEPASEAKYDRSILEGEDCFADRTCEFLITENPLTKENALMTVSYTLFKDFRWIDLNLPDPADVPEGETAESDTPRWGIVGRSWMAEEAVADEGTSILQSYSLEVWVPTDDGVHRMMSLWSESDSSMGEDTVAGATRSGIQGIFEAGDDWIAENP
ncbi:MAG: hypothetical protein GY913_11435 [Proteobacteria bacterium]|nr:hypothetical protein [Pseudomonadota bacterium]MCP4917527.1 hypothetical protein [Pseudomonadota bacterium]